jgi:hypothetical protein
MGKILLGPIDAPNPAVSNYGLVTRVAHALACVTQKLKRDDFRSSRNGHFVGEF